MITHLTRTQYVLVDYENVQAVDLDRIRDLPVKIVFFVGKHQKQVPMSLFRSAVELPGMVEVLESVGTGKNALDMQMAAYAGSLAERDPAGHIHFVSRDKGFDVVVRYLKSLKLMASRSESFDGLPFLSGQPAAAGSTLEERVERVLSRLNKLSAPSRPRKRKTLLSSMHAMFDKQLSEPELSAVLEHLIAADKVEVTDNGGVTYRL